MQLLATLTSKEQFSKFSELCRWLRCEQLLFYRIHHRHHPVTSQYHTTTLTSFHIISSLLHDHAINIPIGNPNTVSPTSILPTPSSQYSSPPSPTPITYIQTNTIMADISSHHCIDLDTTKYCSV